MPDADCKPQNTRVYISHVEVAYYDISFFLGGGGANVSAGTSLHYVKSTSEVLDEKTWCVL
jgi:hypothetical protein